MDTIFALATAHGKAGVAIIRISGPRAFATVSSLVKQDIVVGRNSVRKIWGRGGDFLDEAFILSFPAPNSFTGEDVVELHIHGSVSVIQAVLATLATCDGVRLADAGEFTRRALENGKLDIAQVEGLADLLDSGTEAQRKQALRVLAGDLGRAADQWRRKIIRASALLEATIDFADEDVPVDVTPEVTDLLTEVCHSLDHEIKGVSTAERIRTGFEIAIVGAPNVGKSTLLNALAGRKAAITSEIAGTTRDVIEVRMDIHGMPVTLLDTAGVRETDDYVEGLGIDLALERANNADLVVVLSEDYSLPAGISASDDVLVYKPKVDSGAAECGVSGVTGNGIDGLLADISTRLQKKTANVGIATRERHRVSLVNARRYLGSALALLSYGPDRYEFCVAEIHASVVALDSLIGRIDVESVLDEIFSSFCLGK